MNLSDPGVPRPLTPREAEVLDFMLSVDDPRIDALREQRRSAVVTGRCGCGCATISLDVDRGLGLPVDLCSPAIAAEVMEIAGEPTDPSATVGLLLFLDAGWLSCLEIWWIDVIPDEFPPPSSFERPRVIC